MKVSKNSTTSCGRFSMLKCNNDVLRCGEVVEGAIETGRDGGAFNPAALDSGWHSRHTIQEKQVSIVSPMARLSSSYALMAVSKAQTPYYVTFADRSSGTRQQGRHRDVNTQKHLLKSRCFVSSLPVCLAGRYASSAHRANNGSIARAFFWKRRLRYTRRGLPKTRMLPPFLPPVFRQSDASKCVLPEELPPRKKRRIRELKLKTTLGAARRLPTALFLV